MKTDTRHGTLHEVAVAGTKYRYWSLPATAAADAALAGLSRLPFSLRILAENLLRHADAPDVKPDMLRALAAGERSFEVPFRPARVLLQDLLGVPVMVDFAALRDSGRQSDGDKSAHSRRFRHRSLHHR
jgi:aconitate hydratase